ncbi:MAG: hypothetical protein ABI378_14720 [Chitinophagaceae bacterium]
MTILAFWLGILSCSAAQSSEHPNTHDSGSVFKIKGIALAAAVKGWDASTFPNIQKVNANSVCLMPYAFYKESASEIIFNSPNQWWGERDEGICSSIKMAQKAKLSIMLKPQLWLRGGEYTGNLDFKNDADWQAFKNGYSAYILHFAKLADSMKVESFCLGTELGNLAQKHPEYFRILIDTLRNIFHGKLTYAANWNDYEAFRAWSKLDYIGIDAYFPLDDAQQPSLEKLKRAWMFQKVKLKAISEHYKRPILFTEYGYRNCDFACKEPWSESSTKRNDAAQSIALQAFYESFAHESWTAGGYLWKWYGDAEQINYQNEVDYSPQGKAAMEVVRKWYGR